MFNRKKKNWLKRLAYKTGKPRSRHNFESVPQWWCQGASGFLYFYSGFQIISIFLRLTFVTEATMLVTVLSVIATCHLLNQGPEWCSLESSWEANVFQLLHFCRHELGHLPFLKLISVQIEKRNAVSWLVYAWIYWTNHHGKKNRAFLTGLE